MLAAEAISKGRQARRENNLSAARDHYYEAAGIYREQNDLMGYAHTIRHIADMHLEEANLVDAKNLCEEALEIYRSNLNTKILDLANTIRPYAILSERLGDFKAATLLWQEARTLYGSLRVAAGVSECDARLAQLQQR
jgi:hypothetical protein